MENEFRFWVASEPHRAMFPFTAVKGFEEKCLAASGKQQKQKGGRGKSPAMQMNFPYIKCFLLKKATEAKMLLISCNSLQVIHKSCPSQDWLEALQLLIIILLFFFLRRYQTWVRTNYALYFFPKVMIQSFPCPENYHYQPSFIFHSSKLKISQTLPPVPLPLFSIWWFPEANKDKNSQTENMAVKKKRDTDPEVPFGVHLLTASFSIWYVNRLFSYLSDTAAKSVSFQPSFYERKLLLHSFGTSVRYGSSLLNIACGGEFWMFKQQAALQNVINSHTHHSNFLSMPAVASDWISTTCQWQWDTDRLWVLGFQYSPLTWWSDMNWSKRLQWGARRRACSQTWRILPRRPVCSEVCWSQESPMGLGVTHLLSFTAAHGKVDLLIPKFFRMKVTL